MTRLPVALLLALAGLPAAAQERIGITLEIGPDLAARLLERGSWITVEAAYYGEASPGAAPGRGPMIWLGGEEFSVFPVSQRIELGGALGAMPAGWVVEPLVEITVHTSPLPGKEELIDCDRIHRPLADVAERGRRGENVIACEWFGD